MSQQSEPAYLVIARKYRPSGFDDVVGQGAIARTLRNAISAGRVAHAYMFCGPRGVGKTSMARILARALNCLAVDEPTTEPCGECDLCLRAAAGDDLDVMEIDAASNRKVDDARSLIQNVSFHPGRARFKVYVVDEVHMLTTEAFNALLKTLEEPPAHVKFIFATTDPQKVPATILSRCQRFDFRPVPAADIVALLERICISEGLDAEPEALQEVARASVGGVRDAESLLEQLGTLGGGAVRLEDLHALLGTVPAERMRALFDRLADGDAAGALAFAAEVLDGGTDPGELVRQCMRHAHELTLVKIQGARGADVVAGAERRAALARQAEAFSEATLVYAVGLLADTLRTMRLLGEGRLFSETAIARLAGHGDMRYVDRLVRDLRQLERRLDSGDPGRGDPGSGGSGSGGSGSGGSGGGNSGGGGGQLGGRSGGGGVQTAPRARSPRAPSRRDAPGRPAASDDGERGSQQAPSDEPRAERASTAAADPTATSPRRDADAREEQAPQPTPGAPRITDVLGLRQMWPDVVDLAGRDSRLRTALTRASLESFSGSELKLGFPPSATFHRGILGEQELRERLADCVSEVVGGPVRIVTVQTAEDPAVQAEEREEEARKRAQPLAQEPLSRSEQAAVHECAVTKLVQSKLDVRIVRMERET